MLSDERIKRISQSRSHQINNDFVKLFDSKWDEVCKVIRHSGVDLSKIKLVGRETDYNK